MTLRRILFLTAGGYVSGHEILIETLAVALQRRGVYVQVVLNGRNDGVFPSRLRKAGVPYETLVLGSIFKNLVWTLDSVRYWPLEFRKLRRVIIDGGIDAVITSLPIHLIACAVVAPKHTLLFHYVHNLVPNLLRVPVFRPLLSRVSRVLAVSNFVRADWERVFPNGPRAATVWNGVPVPDPQSVGRDAFSRTMRVSIVGQIIPSKGHALLLEALATLSEAERAKIAVEIVGSGPRAYEEAVAATIAKLGLSETVSVRGHVSNIEKIYGQTDVLVACAQAEPFGLTVIEAALYGVPSIAPNAGGFRETILHGETGLLFNAGDATCLADSLRLVLDPTRRLVLGTAARARAHTFFTDDSMAIRFLSAINLGIEVNTPA